jgi:hypothetical protein
MKLCCGNCIGDRVITEQVIPTKAVSGKGSCSYCGSKDVELIEPHLLKDYFESVIGTIYTLDDNGKDLLKCLMEDWNMFNNKVMDEKIIKDLFDCIWGDQSWMHSKYRPINEGGTKNLDQWEKFKENIKYKNRFFLDKELDDILNTLFAALAISSKDILFWFRARIQETDPIPLNKMGAPPKNISTHGRANPVGIPYLYLASSCETAISEIRPHTGQLVCVAIFCIFETLTLIDLRNPKSTASPFMDNADDRLIVRNNIPFMAYLGNELARPVLPNFAAIEYIPSQYLCEFIKQLGYDGVIYNSSVGDGFNLALFDEKNSIAKSVSQYEILKATLNFNLFS